MSAPLTFGNSPVPWNAGWTGEERYEVRPCRWADGKLAMWSPHKPGVGRPIFAKPHMVRQRRSIAGFICTVCGVHAPEGDRWWFGLGKVQDEWFMTTEAPVHHACAKLALAKCPHLRGRDKDLARFPSGFRVLAAVIGGPAVEADFGLRITADRPVIGHLKLAWPRSRVDFRPNIVGDSVTLSAQVRGAASTARSAA